MSGCCVCCERGGRALSDWTRPVLHQRGNFPSKTQLPLLQLPCQFSEVLVTPQPTPRRMPPL